MEIEDLLKSPSRTKGREATEGVIPGKFALSVGKPSLPAPTGWKWTKLSDVAQLESGHTPSRKHPEYWGGDIPWIGIKDAVDNHGRTITDTYQHVTEFGLANSSARLLPKNTVCLSRTASVGYVTVMGRPMATSQDFINWVCGDGIEPQFLKAVLIAERDSLWRFASGTTHQTIYYPEAKAFHVCLPPLDEQKAIAHILGTIDNKIELNQQMNQTLEAIQWTLFKSWFIESDFSDDWQLLPLEECMEAIIDYRGKTPKKTESGIPLITAKIVKNGRINQPQEFIAIDDYDDWMRRGIPKRGDVVMTTEAPLGEIARLDGKKVALAQRLITLRGKSGLLDNTYLKFRRCIIEV